MEEEFILFLEHLPNWHQRLLRTNLIKKRFDRQAISDDKIFLDILMISQESTTALQRECL